MIGKTNVGGENVTPEVTAQTPLLPLIKQALVGKAQGAGGIDFGEVTCASPAETVTVAHSLGLVPSYVLLIAKDFTAVNGYTYANLNNITLVRTPSSTWTLIGKAPTKTDTEITFKIFSSYPFKTGDYYWIAIV